MAILYAAEAEEADMWLGAMRAIDPKIGFRIWPEWGDPKEIDFIIVGGQAPEDLSPFVNAKAIQSTWAGVNTLMKAALPKGVPVARMVDRGLTASMTEFVVFQALDVLRDGRSLRKAQRDGVWLDPPIADPAKMPVGILGLGTLGEDIARRLIALGFPLKGWSRSPKSVPGVACFAGEAGLADFLAGLKIMICLLPLTPATEGILNAKLFDGLPMGSILMNVGRGGQLAETDLLAALDSGRLSLAMLDVFRQEPLPPDHIFWRRKDIVITPHVAAITRPGTGAEDILENYRRAMAGEPLLNLVDQTRGY